MNAYAARSMQYVYVYDHRAAETIQDTSHRERKKPVVRAPGTLRSQVAKTSGASAHFQHKMRATLGELHRGDKYF